VSPETSAAVGTLSAELERPWSSVAYARRALRELVSSRERVAKARELAAWLAPEPTAVAVTEVASRLLDLAALV